jgi:hypothetical protein
MERDRSQADPTGYAWVVAGRLGLWLVVMLVVALVLAGCGPTRESESSSKKAEQLASQLQAALEKAGLPVPSTDVLTALYGDDGGISCENVDDREHRTGLASFGAYAIGRRVVLDPKVVDYDRAVISTYCPDELDAYNDAVEDLKLESTIPDQD